MAEFTRLNGYDVKDKKAREDIEKIKNIVAPADLEDLTLVNEIKSTSTDNHIPTAKAVFDYVQRIVTGNYYLTFNVTPSTATIVVKDSLDNVITPDANNRYVVTNGTYNYTITASGYNTITDSVTINNSDSTLTINMEEITNYYLTFNVTPSTATIVVKDSLDNVITPDANNRYAVTNGTYTYTITAENYITVNNSIIINNSNQEVTVTMEYNVIDLDSHYTDETKYYSYLNKLWIGTALVGSLITKELIGAGNHNTALSTAQNYVTGGDLLTLSDWQSGLKNTPESEVNSETYGTSQWWLKDYDSSDSSYAYVSSRNSYNWATSGNKGIRPIVKLPQGCKVTSGSGTENDPYIITQI